MKRHYCHCGTYPDSVEHATHVRNGVVVCAACVASYDATHKEEQEDYGDMNHPPQNNS